MCSQIIIKFVGQHGVRACINQPRSVNTFHIIYKVNWIYSQSIKLIFIRNKKSLLIEYLILNNTILWQRGDVKCGKY